MAGRSSRYRSMATKHAVPNPGNPPAVHGLEQGRHRARRRSSRRRTKNAIVSGAMFVVAAGVVGGAGYFLWQFYNDEQERTRIEQPAVNQPTAEELLIEMQDQGRWNGPGAPAFGIGDQQP